MIRAGLFFYMPELLPAGETIERKSLMKADKSVWIPQKGSAYWTIRIFAGRLQIEKAGYYHIWPERTKKDFGIKNYFKSEADAVRFINEILSRFELFQYKHYGTPTQLNLFCEIIPCERIIDYNFCFAHKIENFYYPEVKDKYWTIGEDDYEFFIHADRFQYYSRSNSNRLKQGMICKTKEDAEELLKIFLDGLKKFNSENYGYAAQQELFERSIMLHRRIKKRA